MTDQTQNAAQHEDNKLIAERRAKLSEMRDQGNAFPNAFRRDATAAELQAKYGDKSKEELESLGIKVAIAGRMMLDRKAFKVVQDMTGRIQIYASKDVQKDTKHWDLGDIVGVRGTLSKSGKGDLYVTMDEYVLLTKSLRPLPEKHKGLTDTEARYRHRYVDLMVNEDSRRVFYARSKIISAMRQYFTERDFMEVETPMLQVIPGGATARPFVTHHNALGIDMYLRIAPELFLKRLVVGGFERVFEINRNFRNEGLSTRHNPEFTMVEFYQAYADYNDLMDLTEDMLRSITQKVLGTTTVVNTRTLADGSEETVEYDFGKAFERLTVVDAILRYNPDIKPEQLADDASARQVAKNLGIHLKDGWGLGKVQIEIFEATAEHRLMQPTFITEYPKEVSPLARCKDSNPFVTERFEFFVGGREIANGFSELNDAEDQAERFQAQVAEKEAGDDEAMFYDEDYVMALEYGLPPTAGEGIGIDRLAMLLTNSASIRDVILFPAMRPEHKADSRKDEE
ncbi:lysine--tRNA ligase [Marinobacter flavimaris]|jgi:lysyl-tRNA synthetase class 2|uniref:Lysine--tRNA ligase n=2 Tax=Marinobacter TaxID=2742 RepID=A0A3D8H4W1_9GAMM|nr:lysine--tRNA ligase [Marinobacter flavimaris]MTI75984.1 lysine--tRNA ligase [Marinobacter sp.]HAS77951.1 lysine--tRNA ligase [Marinobacter adhaerens]PPI81245.1 lysine--tRNA ligase [Marinobacter flavimaris]RDU41697.1 lysine--tRNA ligase [Marinobacter flavimaris]HBI79021.1 lysine--tRNA ligase [Marinobacter adhaerens]|tara:strand:- start:822 stop:2357 length:1536 start_codon:yes stop_codon:yes gene_type:complete